MDLEVRRHSKSSPWSYLQLDQRQREVAERIRAGGPGAILLSELSPVITLGRRASRSDLLLTDQEYRSKGIEILHTDRGGLATYHGPGQWVLFMVDHLDRLTGDSRGVRKFVDAALAVALHVGQIYDPGASVREGAEMGVWKSDGSKFAALGVHIEQRVVMHGIAINGYRAEPSFVGIRPCGLESPVGYLFDESTHFETLGEQILKAITLDFPRVKVARSSRSACFEQTPENLDRAKDLPAREAD